MQSLLASVLTHSEFDLSHYSQIGGQRVLKDEFDSKREAKKDGENCTMTFLS
jgi:hypothetical protein